MVSENQFSGKTYFYTIASSATLCTAEADQLSDAVARMAAEWAPLVWIHSAEPFYPSSVDFFLENTEGGSVKYLVGIEWIF